MYVYNHMHVHASICVCANPRANICSNCNFTRQHTATAKTEVLDCVITDTMRTRNGKCNLN